LFVTYQYTSTGQNVIYLPHEESKPYNRKIILTPNNAGLETIDLKPKSVACRLWLAGSKLKLLAKEREILKSINGCMFLLPKNSEDRFNLFLHKHEEP
jgi:hypothetical protein